MEYQLNTRVVVILQMVEPMVECVLLEDLRIMTFVVVGMINTDNFEIDFPVLCL